MSRPTIIRPLPLSPGTRVGSYEITASIGAGGMGEVYRAHDSKLKRDVAIKVLPAGVAGDPERLARFRREAEVLASLNHPHIAHVYGLEDTALVMELVEGEDLAERIARGPITLDEALPIARQIAEALEAAHDSGIIHRDLKPANIKLRSDGTVKVLDFGLAKALEPGSGIRDPGPARDPANSPTITSPAMMTAHGMVLGTAAYMSPEQAKGKPVDQRADVWAFGCVLYEMLSGKKAFTGEDVTDTLTAVMRDTPDWQALPFETPAALRTLLRRCIEKDPRKRAPHMAIARMEIDDAMTSTGELVHAPTGEPSRVSGRTVAAVAIVAGSVALIGGWALGRSAAPAPQPAAAIRFQFDGPFASEFSQRVTAFLAVAPDGQRVAYIGHPRGRPAHVWIHSFGDGSAREFENTSGVTQLFWSPDSKHIAFQTPGLLSRLDLSSGTVQPIAGTGNGGYGTWAADGTILYADVTIRRVPASGGQPDSVTTINTAQGDQRHVRPTFLPDGRHFVFTAINTEIDKSTLQLGELGATTTRILDETVSGANYVEPGYLVFARDGKLMARPFDAALGQWTGEPMVIADTVRQVGLGAAFSASVGGVIAYDNSNLSGQGLDLAWVMRDGRPASIAAQLEGGHAIALAGDDTSVAMETSANGVNAVWLYDTVRGTRTRLTFDKGVQGHPVWSPEGRRLVYFDGRPGSMTRLFIKVANGTRDAEPLLGPNHETPGFLQPTDWSRDGRYIVYEEQQGPGRSFDLKYVDLRGDRAPAVAVGTPSSERLGQLSPDGKLIAYESTETGEPQVYVATFPDASMRWTISSRGGIKPRWSNNGRELVFVDLDGMLHSVAINVSGGFRAGVPAPLFPLNGVDTDGYNYAISRDGTKFLIMRPSQEGPPARVNVIMNWPATVAR